MARPIYYRQMRNCEKPRYLVSEYCEGKWEAVIRFHSLETAVKLYSGQTGFRVKDTNTGKIVWESNAGENA